MPDIGWDIVAALSAVAFVAGFVDSIAGGGGLLTVPALLLAGLSPVQAIATNKLQAVLGVASATVSYAARGQVDLRGQSGHAMIALAGGAAGALLAAHVPADLFRLAMPVLLVAVALYFALKRDLGDRDRAARMSTGTLGLAVVPVIALYDGIFGPGAGSFYMLALVTLAGYGLLKATAHTKLLNLASNVGGFLVFAVSGAILWKVGLAMCVGQVLGARLGSSLAMRNGARLIRPLLVAVCLAMAGRLALDPAGPLHVLFSK